MGKEQVSMPFRLVNSQIYLSSSLDGKRYDNIVFDTGATNVVSAAAAKSAGIKTEGALPGGGFGENVAAFGLARIAVTDVGGVELRDQVFTVIDLGSLSKAEGAEEASGKAVKIPFKFNSHIPHGGRRARRHPGRVSDRHWRSFFHLDHAPFCRIKSLTRKIPSEDRSDRRIWIRWPSTYVINTAIEPENRLNRNKRADWIDWTRRKKRGRFDPTAGNLGARILKRFTVALDYEHQVLYLEPNASFAEPNVFDRSGLWCMQDEGSGLQIVDVVKNSPADKAGFQAGDHILGLDGTAMKGSQFIDLRSKLKQAPSTKVRLQVEGKAGKPEVCLTPAELS